MLKGKLLFFFISSRHVYKAFQISILSCHLASGTVKHFHSRTTPERLKTLIYLSSAYFTGANVCIDVDFFFFFLSTDRFIFFYKREEKTLAMNPESFGKNGSHCIVEWNFLCHLCRFRLFPCRPLYRHSRDLKKNKKDFQFFFFFSFLSCPEVIRSISLVFTKSIFFFFKSPFHAVIS